MSLAGIAARLVFTAKRHAPEIKFIFGVVSMGGAMIATHKATLKSQEIKAERDQLLKEAAETMEMVKREEISPEEYTPEDYKNDVHKINAVYYGAVTLKYAVAFGLAILSTSFFLGAVIDLRNLFLGMSAAYETMALQQKQNLEMVKEEVGEEKYAEMGLPDDLVVERIYRGIGDPNIDLNEICMKEDAFNVMLHSPGVKAKTLNEILIYWGFEPVIAGQVLCFPAYNDDGTENVFSTGVRDVHSDALRWHEHDDVQRYVLKFTGFKPIDKYMGWKQI